jgi:hypothetical protein
MFGCNTLPAVVLYARRGVVHRVGWMTAVFVQMSGSQLVIVT